MNGGAVIRAVFILAAIASPFLFPYPVTVILSFMASMFVPYVAFAIGMLTDAIYLVPQGETLPLATMIGLGVSLFAFLVRRFIKARIIGG